MFQNNEQLFEDKKNRRKERAKMPIEQKIEELIRLQEIALAINKTLREKGLKAWKSSSRFNRCASLHPSYIT